MKIITKNKTKILLSSRKTTTVKTVVPARVRDFLQLKKGDTLTWDTCIENDELFVILKKEEQ